MKTISTFTITKNEVDYVGFNIMAVLDHVDEMIFVDGESNDGTVELIKYIQNKYDKDKKIRLYQHKEHTDYAKEYEDLWNKTLGYIRTDYGWFLHPDMIVVNPEIVRDSVQTERVRYTYNIVSFAGDRKHIFTKGRDLKWAHILKNGHGLHYACKKWGSDEEDFYFREFTGSEHLFYKNVQFLPYKIWDTSIKVYHYCDTKPYEYRKERMRKIIEFTQPDLTPDDRIKAVENHPRVTCKPTKYNYGRQFEISEVDLEEPEVFKIYAEEFKGFRKPD